MCDVASSQSTNTPHGIPRPLRSLFGGIVASGFSLAVHAWLQPSSCGSLEYSVRQFLHTSYGGQSKKKKRKEKKGKKKKKKKKKKELRYGPTNFKLLISFFSLHSRPPARSMTHPAPAPNILGCLRGRRSEKAGECVSDGHLPCATTSCRDLPLSRVAERRIRPYGFQPSIPPWS
ncbi:hypothetical protein MAPG_00069 [Magnaporthiopsis poae ATCC 64411]|uniref:Uncharacterized protein n=1 Tax=Magnaporthiopsis poae (strain ATCC 64411 / 73-15) TaxID=644358 RepID=A0A0C4DK07_MAGP6|nr:hypothetical protein MAPG_00069 [Magnaporthiopsis poae ATCC 64411]